MRLLSVPQDGSHFTPNRCRDPKNLGARRSAGSTHPDPDNAPPIKSIILCPS